MAKKQEYMCIMVDGQQVCANADELVQRLNDSIGFFSGLSGNSGDHCRALLALYNHCASFTVQNKSFIAPKRRKVKGIMLHNPQDPTKSGAQMVAHFNETKNASISVNAVIDDETGTMYQCLPWDWKANHCAGDLNASHISIELCEPSGAHYYKWEAKVDGVTRPLILAEKLSKDDEKLLDKGKLARDISVKACWVENGRIACGKAFSINAKWISKSRPMLFEDLEAARRSVQNTFNSTVDLCARLCWMYGLDPLAKAAGGGKGAGKSLPYTIICHKEGHVNFGKASNHGDVEKLWDSLNKELKKADPTFPKDQLFTMDNLRKKVAARMEEFRAEEKARGQSLDWSVGIMDLKK